MKPHKQNIAVHISPEERNVLMRYTNTPLELLQKIDAAIAKAQLKRAIVKRVAVHYTINELNTIITTLAAQVNQRNVSREAQYVLSSLS